MTLLRCNNPECGANENMFLSTHRNHRNEQLAKLKHIFPSCLLLNEQMICCVHLSGPPCKCAPLQQICSRSSFVPNAWILFMAEGTKRVSVIISRLWVAAITYPVQFESKVIFKVSCVSWQTVLGQPSWSFLTSQPTLSVPLTVVWDPLTNEWRQEHNAAINADYYHC